MTFFFFLFQDPIINYRTPIKQLINWFDLLTVTKKREDIALLIKDLAIKNGRAIQFPDITLPTENGQLLDTPDFLEEHGDFEDDESTLVTQEVKKMIDLVKMKLKSNPQFKLNVSSYIFL